MTPRLKSIALISLLTLVLPFTLKSERRNLQVTVTAGTPVRLAPLKLRVNRLFIQSRAGNTGIGYVMLGVKASVSCSATNAAYLTAELAPGTSTSPGGSFSDPQGADGMSPADAEDLSTSCIDGTHTGDVYIVSFWARD